MEKRRAAVLAMALCLALTSASAMALPSVTDRAAAREAEVKAAAAYAYMDLEAAPPHLRETILEARRVIIYSQGWVADGYEGFVIDVENGAVLKELPQFSALFPAGWDIPRAEPLPAPGGYRVGAEADAAYAGTAEADEPYPGLAAAVSPDRVEYYNVSVQAPPPNTTTPPFGAVRFVARSHLDAFATRLPGSFCNIGFSDPTGASLLYETNLPIRVSARLNVSPLLRYAIAIRASTYDTTGTGDFVSVLS
jgi:hypothetical protein